MRYTRLDFMNRFTDTELATIFTAAKSSVAVEIWLAKFNAAMPDADGTSVDTCDQRTIDGLQALEVGGLLSTGRATEILGGLSTVGTASLLAPFNERFPDVYNITGLSSDGVATLEGIGDFNAEYYTRIS